MITEIAAPLKNRFLSLDVFRGITISFMIIVNSKGTGAIPYAPLLHASWHGFTPTDLVFPSFLFAVGNSMGFSMKKTAILADSIYFSRVLKRSLIIFLLGYLMYWFPFFKYNEAGEMISFPISQTRILGVLQRIAICYFAASFLLRYFTFKQNLLISLFLLAGYWLLLILFGKNADVFGMESNFGSLIDRFLLGEQHMYHKNGLVFEPEGLLSTVPAIVNVIAGYYAGLFIQKKGILYEGIAKLQLAGALLILLALCINPFMPVNKKLWTSSFVLLTVGLDLCIMAVLLFCLEIKKWNRGNWTRFFVIFGKNPLFIYLLSEVAFISFKNIHTAPGQNLLEWINTSIFQVIAPGPAGSLLFAISFMLFCWSVAWLLDHKKIYIKV